MSSTKILEHHGSKLKEILSKYSYHHTPRDDSFIYYDPEREQTTIYNFSKYGMDQKAGPCNIVSNTALGDLREFIPELHYYKIIGWENKYFKQPWSHVFIVATEEDILNGLPRATGEYAQQILLDNNTILLDPSFNIVTSYSESDYHAKETIGQPSIAIHPQHLTFNSSSLGWTQTAVGMSSKGEVVFIQPNSNKPHDWNIGFIDTTGSKKYNIRTEELETIASNDLLVRQWKTFLQSNSEFQQ